MSSAVCVERIALAATVALWFGLLLHVIVAAERSVLVLMVLVLAVLVMVLVVLVTLMLITLVVVAILLLPRRAPVPMPVARACRPTRLCHSLVEEVLLHGVPHAGVAGA